MTTGNICQSLFVWFFWGATAVASFSQSADQEAARLIRRIDSLNTLGDYRAGLEAARATFFQVQNEKPVDSSTFLPTRNTFLECLFRCGYFHQIDSITALVLAGEPAFKQSRSEAFLELITLRGRTLTMLDRFDEALELFSGALPDTVDLLSDAPRAVARFLSAYGHLLVVTEDYDRGEQVLTQADRLFRKEQGSHYLDLIENLIFRAELFFRQDQFPACKHLLDEAIRLLQAREETENHPVYGLALDWLGLYHFTLGFYGVAREYLEKARGIFEFRQLEGHPHYASVLMDLGFVVEDIVGSNLDQVELLFDRSVQINSALVTEGARVGLGIGNLALVHLKLGDYEKSLEEASFAVKCLKDKPKILEYSIALNNLGKVYLELDSLDRAAELFAQSRSIYLSKYPEKSLHYISFLENESALDQNSENREFVYQKSLEIINQLTGPNVPLYSTLLNNLAVYYDIDLQNPEKAESIYLEAERLTRDIYGPLHPAYIQTLYNLAGFYHFWEQDIPSAAEKSGSYYLLANAAQLQLIDNYYASFDEATRLRYLEQAMAYFALFFDYAARKENRRNFSKEVQKIIYQVKGSALTYSLANRLWVHHSADLQTEVQYHQWIAIRETLAKAYLMSVAERQTLGLGIDQLKDEARRIEKELARQSNVGTNLISEAREFNFQAIQDNLTDGEAVIDFFAATYLEDNFVTDTSFYYALVTLRGQPVPYLVPLAMDVAIEAILNLPARGAPAYVTYPSEGHRLYDLIWKPLEPFLQNVHTVHLIPDGLLHQIAFAALPSDSEGSRFLIDQYQIYRYCSLRDLLSNSRNFKSKGNAAVLFGGALYDLDVAVSQEIVPKPDRPGDGSDTLKVAEYQSDLSIHREDASRAPGRFNYLPGTELEVQIIDSLLQNQGWQSTVFLRERALEGQLKALSGQATTDILHLATHGFFFEALNEAPYDSAGLVWERIFASPEPLSRSGLVFSGCNAAWRSRTGITDREDQILTASEVAILDLSSIPLAVLSACDTGRGDVKNAEGVFGLQRAFQSAGVNKLLLSLWKIPDQATVTLMKSFYSYLLDGANPADALRNAQLDMRTAYPASQWGAFFLSE